MKSRFILKDIITEKDSHKISIIIGARQVGKTTLLKELHNNLGGLFLDLDMYSNYEKVATYENFINTLILNGYRKDQKEIFYVFLDEFQRYKDISLILKNIYDHHNNIKIFATGSSSLAIKANIQESLAGRKHITYIYPLNFREFLFFKERGDLIEKLNRLKEIRTPDLSQLV